MSVVRGYKSVRVNSDREWRFSLLICVIVLFCDMGPFSEGKEYY